MARTGMCAKFLGRTLEPKKLAKLPVVSKSVPYPSEWSSGRAARGLDHSGEGTDIKKGSTQKGM